MNYLDQALTSTYSASGVLLPGTGGVPIAPELHANPVVAWVSIVLAYAGAAAALAWALWKLVKHQQMLPLVLFAAGLVAANIEPLGDLVGSIVYANDTPWFGYTVMGRRMPAWILVGASSYVAIGGYIAYRYISQGRSLRDIFVLSAVYVGIPEIAIEMIWHYTGIIAYYGDNPTRVGDSAVLDCAEHDAAAGVRHRDLLYGEVPQGSSALAVGSLDSGDNHRLHRGRQLACLPSGSVLGAGARDVDCRRCGDCHVNSVDISTLANTGTAQDS